MDKEKLNKYKESLEKKRADLLEDMKDVPLVTDMGSDVESDSFDEETDEAEEMFNDAATREVLKKRLDDIEATLKKIEDGSFK
ncbi:MAG: hypothetical protein ABH822_00050 [Patescibacteria group bacterium]